MGQVKASLINIGLHKYLLCLVILEHVGHFLLHLTQIYISPQSKIQFISASSISPSWLSLLTEAFA